MRICCLNNDFQLTVIIGTHKLFSNGNTEETGLDNRRTMEGSAIDKLVGGSETGRRIYKTIEASNNTGSTSTVLTIEELEELESLMQCNYRVSEHIGNAFQTIDKKDLNE